ncbi:MAG: hypothetical protein DMF49_04580, partial [Acidobacteria bacterium]
IYGTRISSSGRILDARIPICVKTGEQASETVGWDGENYLVAWDNLREDGLTELQGIRVSRRGAVMPLEQGGFEIMQAPAGIADVAGGASGRWAVLYTRFARELGNDRVFLRFVDDCDEGPAADCSFHQVHPPDNSAVSSLEPPVFWWEPGDLDHFRVEFSADDSFTGPMLRSGKRLVAGTSYRPDDPTWARIQGLAAPGEAIYWRVVGKARGSAGVTSRPSLFIVRPERAVPITAQIFSGPWLPSVEGSGRTTRVPRARSGAGTPRLKRPPAAHSL